MALVTDGLEKVWYFAYGANISSSVFTDRRKIVPLQTEPATIRSHALCFNAMGIPYSEPAMEGLLERRGADDASEKPSVLGVMYLLSPRDFPRVIASEG